MDAVTVLLDAVCRKCQKNLHSVLLSVPRHASLCRGSLNLPARHVLGTSIRVYNLSHLSEDERGGWREGAEEGWQGMEGGKDGRREHYFETVPRVSEPYAEAFAKQLCTLLVTLCIL